MALIAETPTGKEFELPKEGTIQAVLNTVKDLGMIDVVFQGISKKTHKCQMIWVLAEKDNAGVPKLIFERFTVSLHPKSQLYKRIKGLFGKEPPATLDLEKLIGTNANLVIVHQQGTDRNGQPKAYANVAATLKLRPDQKKLEIVPLDQIIKPKDAVKAEVAKTTTTVTTEAPIIDEDFPF